MNYRQSSARLAEYRRQIADLRTKMRETRAATEPEEVADYVFTNCDGSVHLSELFGGKPDLIVIHNMGASCPSCTLWADGFNGVYDHLVNRCFCRLEPRCSGSAEAVRCRSRMALSDVEPSGNDIRGGYGLPLARRRLVAGNLGVPPRTEPDPAGVRHRLLPRRRFLCPLAHIRFASRRRRSLAAEISLWIRKSSQRFRAIMSRSPLPGEAGVQRIELTLGARVGRCRACRVLMVYWEASGVARRTLCEMMGDGRQAEPGMHRLLVY